MICLVDAAQVPMTKTWMKRYSSTHQYNFSNTVKYELLLLISWSIMFEQPAKGGISIILASKYANRRRGAFELKAL